MPRPSSPDYSRMAFAISTAFSLSFFGRFLYDGGYSPFGQGISFLVFLF